MANEPYKTEHKHLHYIVKKFDYGDIGSTVTVGDIPGNSIIHKAASGIAVTIAFNSGTSCVADVGISGTGEKYASDLTLAAKGFVPLDVNESGLVTADTTLILSGIAQTGTPASAGEAYAVVVYMPLDR